MNKTLSNTKCKCGKDIEEYGTKYIIDPLSPEFVCFDCWKVDKEKKSREVKTCCRCGERLKGKDFIDHRFCLTPNKDGKFGWYMICIECEPYIIEEGKH